MRDGNAAIAQSVKPEHFRSVYDPMFKFEVVEDDGIDEARAQRFVAIIDQESRRLTKLLERPLHSYRDFAVQLAAERV